MELSILGDLDLLLFVFSLFSVFCSSLAPFLSSFGLFEFFFYYFILIYFIGFLSVTFLVVALEYIIHISNLSQST